VLVSSYDYRLVALSVLIAILASYAALDLAGRVTFARGRARLLWLSGGASAMGLGIWSMHYIGMLAFQLPIQVRYDWPTVLVSLLAAIFASAVALFVVSRQRMGLFRAFVGSIVMGSGIAAMHYIGMAAMRLQAMCVYSPTLLTLSVILAIVIGFVALWLAFHFRDQSHMWGLKAISAVMMGAAIPVMHYTGMAAASFVPSSMAHQDLSHAVSISSLGITGIVLGTSLVLVFVFLTSRADRHISLQALQLKSSEQRYRQIVETALDAFIGMDSRGLVADWNAQAAATFGWSRADVIGKDLSQIIIPERYRETYRQGLQQLVTGEGAVGNMRREITALHRDGGEFPAELTISALHTGETHLFAAFVRDITARQLSERELIVAKEAAEAGSRAKSEFLANISHEIRTPLNGVIGMTGLALDTDLTLTQRDYLEIVKSSADALLVVLSDMLDFSKIEAGRIELAARDFNLRESLELTMKSLAAGADEKGLELLCDIGPGVPDALRGDANRLRQVVVNLVGNAIKFTHAGEVAVTVQVDAEDGDDRVLHFAGSDTGIGIAPDKREWIFQPFAQEDASSTREYGGTGLGLTISTRIVTMMGGKIWVDSDTGKGTAFHFTVRLTIADSQAAAAGAAVPPDTLRGVRVLVVDDNRTSRRILNGMLKRWEMRPTSVADGEAALVQLALAREAGAPYGLIVIDAGMPAMNGFALVEAMCQRPDSSTPTLMMLTSANHRRDVARCRDLGGVANVSKPIRQGELHEAIARVLSPALVRV
jgi:PAS domain S-box-containing protein